MSELDVQVMRLTCYIQGKSFASGFLCKSWCQYISSGKQANKEFSLYKKLEGQKKSHVLLNRQHLQVNHNKKRRMRLETKVELESCCCFYGPNSRNICDGRSRPDAKAFLTQPAFIKHPSDAFPSTGVQPSSRRHSCIANNFKSTGNFLEPKKETVVTLWASDYRRY